MSNIGAHVSTAGGVAKAAARASKQGCEVMQIFVQSPQAFITPETSLKEADDFKKSCSKYNIKEVYVHAPYIINLASSNNRIRYGSISLIKKNLARASALSCKYLMTHLGSSSGYKDKSNSLMVASESIKKIIENYEGTCKLLLEVSSGSGAIIGSRFDEIAYLLQSNHDYEIGVCLDTAHIFASGYNLSDTKAINATLGEFNRLIGLSRLLLVHLNDSMAPFGSKKDRHADIGDGEIGLKSLIDIVNHPKLSHCDFILETPGTDDRRLKDLTLLKKVRSRKQ